MRLSIIPICVGGYHLLSSRLPPPSSARATIVGYQKYCDLPVSSPPRQKRHLSTGHRGHRPSGRQSGPWVPLPPVVAGTPFHTHHLNVLRSSPFCSQVHTGDVVAALFVPETTCEATVFSSELARAFLRWTHCVHPHLRLLTTCRPSIGWNATSKRLSLGLRTVNGPCLHRNCRVRFESCPV